MKFFGVNMLIIVLILILSGCAENEGIAEENDASIYECFEFIRSS